MARLKNRQHQIPGGFRFYQPQTKWQPPNFASFDTIVQGLISHRNANPALRDKHRWPTDQPTVEIEVDEFNARICEQAGWTDYISSAIGGAPPPFFPAPSQTDQSKLNAAAGAVKKIWAGVRTLNDWLDSGELPVSPAQSTARAAVCAKCPQNAVGDFDQWFTRPASEAIRRQLEKVKGRQLATDHDDKLNVCRVCLCPLRLAVHAPISYKAAHLTQTVMDELEAANAFCWVVAEIKALPAKPA